jgi:hypothetical protein
MKTLLFLCATFLSPLLVAAPASAQPAPAPAAAPASAQPAPAPAAAPAAGEVTTTAAPAPAAPAAPAAGEVTTTAAPAAAPVAPVAPVAGEMAAVPGSTPPELKQTCMDAINSDQQWTNELTAIIEKRVRFQVHNEESELIAMNKRHVVLAYAVLWLIAVGFLVMQWLRQQALKRQIEALTRDLETAIKEPAK